MASRAPPEQKDDQSASDDDYTDDGASDGSLDGSLDGGSSHASASASSPSRSPTSTSQQQQQQHQHHQQRTSSSPPPPPPGPAAADDPAAEKKPKPIRLAPSLFEGRDGTVMVDHAPFCELERECESVPCGTSSAVSLHFKISENCHECVDLWRESERGAREKGLHCVVRCPGLTLVVRLEISRCQPLAITVPASLPHCHYVPLSHVSVSSPLCLICFPPSPCRSLTLPATHCHSLPLTPLLSPRYNAVRNAFLRAGFKRTTGSNFNGYWGRHLNTSQFRKLMPYQRVNHFPGTWGIGRKDRLARNMQRMKRDHGEEFNVIAESYIMPADKGRLKAEFSSNPKQVSFGGGVYSHRCGRCGRCAYSARCHGCEAVVRQARRKAIPPVVGCGRCAYSARCHGCEAVVRQL